MLELNSVKADSTSVLAKTSLQAILDQFLAAFTQPIDLTHLDVSLAPLTNEIVFTAREISTLGVNGKYSGAHRVKYTKSDLNKVLPYPVLYQGGYPVTFFNFRLYMLERYNMILEEGEFTVAGGNGQPLYDTTRIDQTPDNTTSQVIFNVLPESGRWKLGGQLRVTVVPTYGKTSIPGLIADPTSELIDLSQLVFPDE